MLLGVSWRDNLVGNEWIVSILSLFSIQSWWRIFQVFTLYAQGGQHTQTCAVFTELSCSVTCVFSPYGQPRWIVTRESGALPADCFDDGSCGCVDPERRFVRTPTAYFVVQICTSGQENPQ